VQHNVALSRLTERSQVPLIETSRAARKDRRKKRIRKLRYWGGWVGSWPAPGAGDLFCPLALRHLGPSPAGELGSVDDFSALFHFAGDFIWIGERRGEKRKRQQDPTSDTARLRFGDGNRRAQISGLRCGGRGLGRLKYGTAKAVP